MSADPRLPPESSIRSGPEPGDSGPVGDRPIRVVAIMEALTVTGPARNLLEFAVRARNPDGRNRPAHIEILSFVRGVGSGSPDNAFLAAARSRGIAVHAIPERSRFDLKVLSGLAATLRRLAPDIVQSHGVKSHFLLSLPGVRGAVPWIAFHHGYTAENLKMRFYNQMDRWSVPRADRVVTVCTPFAAHLAQTGVRPDRIAVLPNTIDSEPPVPPERVAALRNELGISGAERVILAVGRLSPEKGHFDLLKAVGMLGSRHPEVRFRLILVGDGPLRAELERVAADSGLADRVTFAGHQADVTPYYHLAEIFILPSHSEGSPNVLLEAMRRGLPVAATDVGGVADMIEDGVSGLLVPARNPAELCEAAAKLLTGGEEVAAAMGRRAAARISAHFRPENYRQTLLEIYRKTLSGGTR